MRSCGRRRRRVPGQRQRRERRGVGSRLHGTLYGIDVATGTVLVTKDLGDYSTSTPAIVDGVVYVGSDSGALMAFGLPE